MEELADISSFENIMQGQVVTNVSVFNFDPAPANAFLATIRPQLDDWIESKGAYGGDPATRQKISANLINMLISSYTGEGIELYLDNVDKWVRDAAEGFLDDYLGWSSSDWGQYEEIENGIKTSFGVEE